MSFQEAVWSDFASITMPYFIVLWVAIALDVALGMACGFALKVADSSISRVGLTRKAAMLGIVLAFAIGDGLFPMIQLWGMQITIAGGWCAFWMLTEVLSILENAAKLGLPLPKGLKKRLIQVRNSIDVNAGGD